LDEAAITRYIATTFDGVDVDAASKESGAPEIAWGDTFFTQLDRLMPHPVYGRNHFVCVLNPSESTFQAISPLLKEAYEIAVRRVTRRSRQRDAD